MTNKQKVELLKYAKEIGSFQIESIYENKKVVSFTFKEIDLENYLTIYEENTKDGKILKVIFVGEELPEHTAYKNELIKIYNKFKPKDLISC